MTTTPKISDLPAEQLAAELARREQEQRRKQAEHAQRLEAARRTHAEQTWNAREQTEAELQERGQRAREEFSAAVKSADLAGAFAAWMAERASRYARESVRNKTAGAGRVLGDDQANHLADVRWYSPDFLARLEDEADKAARANGYDLADELVPDAPTEVE